MGEVALVVEEAIGHDHMEVYVQLQRRAEALNEGDGAGVRGLQTHSPGPLPRVGEERTDAGALHDGESAGVSREQKAQAVGERKDPLAVGYAGQHVVCEVNRGVRGAARAARGADPAFFARERDEEVLAP